MYWHKLGVGEVLLVQSKLSWGAWVALKKCDIVVIFSILIKTPSVSLKHNLTVLGVECCVQTDCNVEPLLIPKCNI